VYPLPYRDCEGQCLNDGDGDGQCDEEEVPGCMQPLACNYDPFATDDDGSCSESCKGCTYDAAQNFDNEATVDDGTCQFNFSENPCPTDLNGSGTTDVADLLLLLGAFSEPCN